MIDIIVAVIVGAFSLIGVIVSNIASNQKTQAQIKSHVEVTDQKIEHLTEEVKKHNNFAQKIPEIKSDMTYMQKYIDRLEKDISDLESKLNKDLDALDAKVTKDIDKLEDKVADNEKEKK